MGNTNKLPPAPSAHVSERVAAKLGPVSLSGRYHKPPNKFEDHYQVTKTVLGSGMAGEIKLATRKGSSTQEKYAIKSFNLINIRGELRDQLEVEVEIYLLMDHPHVCRLYDVYETRTRLHLVMECMEGGELFDRVIKMKTFSENNVAEVTYQMLLAVNYIHSHGIVHRDIKLENFLYEKQDSDHLKLIDFGFSKAFDENTKMHVSCGTLSYIAPEVLDKNYTSQCDLWSLGVIVFVCLVGYMPFSGNETDQMKKIRAGEFKLKPEKWDSISSEAMYFVKGLLQVRPDRRFTAAQALEEAFILNRSAASKVKVDSSIVDALRQFSQASKFRRHCLEMMAWSLSTEERANVREHFLAMDTDKQGTVSLTELKKVIVDSYDIDDAEASAIFNALDSNHDDEINYSEFLAAMVSTKISLHDDLLHNAFNRFDTDNSGVITAANMRELLGQTCSDQQIKEVMADAEQLHNGTMTYAEFASYIRGGGATEKILEAAEAVVENELRLSAVVKRASLVAKTKEQDLPNPKTKQCCALM